MKKRNILIYFAFLVTALCACTQNEDLESTIAPGYETTPMHLELSTSGMTLLGTVEADTRAGAKIVRADAKKKEVKKEEVNSEDASSSLDVKIGTMQRAETRTVLATEEEKTINNFTILQFNSTDRTLVYVKHMAGDGNSVDVDLAQTGGSCIVWVVANAGDISSAYTVGTTTEEDFRASEISKTASAGDLPMVGSESINMATETTLAVTLNFMVAKVVFTPTVTMPTSVGTFAITSVRLKNVPTQVAVDAIDETEFTDAEIQELPGITTGATTWYVPENPAGTKEGITVNSDRGDYNAPKETAMYAEVVGNFTPNGAGVTETSAVTYQVYLGNGTVTNFDVARNTVYNVAASIRGVNVTDGRVIIGEDLSNNGDQTANCYIALRRNTYYRFDATRQGNGKTVLLTAPEVLGAASATGVSATNITATAVSPVSAHLIWETSTTTEGADAGNVIHAVGLSKRNCVVFRTGSSAEGNAVIGVREATTAAGTVAWSWHIWKTAIDPRTSVDEFAVRNNRTGLFVNAAPWTAHTERSMQRNLGAANNTPGNVLSGGLLYQWGRKDPFIGSADYAEGSTVPYPTRVPDNRFAWRDGSIHTTATTAINPNSGLGGATAEAYAIAHPTHFIIQHNETTFDWYAATRERQNDNLWGNPNSDPAPSASQLPNPRRGLKSKYDPCPYGWRVAPQDTWTSFTKSFVGTGTAAAPQFVGGNNYGVAQYQTWNVVGNRTGATLANVQAVFTRDTGWTFYFDGNGDGTSLVNTVYFPASGYRHRGSGAFNFLAIEGDGWSSSSYGAGNISGGYLYTQDVHVFPLFGAGRPYGLPVRCVQE